MNFIILNNIHQKNGKLYPTYYSHIRFLANHLFLTTIIILSFSLCTTSLVGAQEEIVVTAPTSISLIENHDSGIFSDDGITNREVDTVFRFDVEGMLLETARIDMEITFGENEPIVARTSLILQENASSAVVRTPRSTFNEEGTYSVRARQRLVNITPSEWSEPVTVVVNRTAPTFTNHPEWDSTATIFQGEDGFFIGAIEHQIPPIIEDIFKPAVAPDAIEIVYATSINNNFDPPSDVCAPSETIAEYIYNLSTELEYNELPVDGSIRVCARATDIAGNVAYSNATQPLKIDTSFPAISGTPVLAASGNDPRTGYVGEILSLTFQVTESLSSTPVVTIAGKDTSITGIGTEEDPYIATTGVIVSTDPAGQVSYTIQDFMDLRGNSWPQGVNPMTVTPNDPIDNGVNISFPPPPPIPPPAPPTPPSPPSPPPSPPPPPTPPSPPTPPTPPPTPPNPPPPTTTPPPPPPESTKTSSSRSSRGGGVRPSSQMFELTQMLEDVKKDLREMSEETQSGTMDPASRDMLIAQLQQQLIDLLKRINELLERQGG